MCGMMWDFQSINMMNFNFPSENNMKYLQAHVKFGSLEANALIMLPYNF